MERFKPSRISEALGLGAGVLMAPAFGLGSILRRARVFHPHGICLIAEVQPAMDVRPPFDRLARGLSGNALVRLSAGTWRRESFLPDLLGMAVRFGAVPQPGLSPNEESQDLLLVTASRLWSLPIEALKTDQHDFLANVYHGLSPFEILGHPDMRLRAVPTLHPYLASTNADRYEKIQNAMDRGLASFRLEAAYARRPEGWLPLVDIDLVRRLDIDDGLLRFQPFQNGQGIRPQGFVQFLRPAPYRVSQYLRPKSTERIQDKTEPADFRIKAAAIPPKKVSALNPGAGRTKDRRHP